jgi:hypothetical protein
MQGDLLLRAVSACPVQIFAGWVATLIVAGFVAAFVTAIGVFSPNKIASNDNVTVTNILDTETLHMIRQLNNTANATANSVLSAQLMVCAF